ncbi:hypothetical protein [Magnetospirillum sulfuroxidans]|uniref:Uncharacterized protein n=1 Tax=Magnetospirillum sulfuroxidans TaxID=611300 RepID=A0ABS5ICL5_9PROT|nr:hypothetical protein [Magnetospirillum sulfuroxidans]MBR9972170.1 hypothetical protein [Magnetospirillum sulfuroxidans]
MQNSPSLTVPLPMAPQQPETPRGFWQTITAFLRGTSPLDPIRYRLDRLNDISLRTWLPAPIREEIGHSIAQGSTIAAIRTSGSMAMDPWDIERASAIWCAEADGIIHKSKWFSISVGLLEILLTLGILFGAFYWAYSELANGSLEKTIQSILPTEWQTIANGATAKGASAVHPPTLADVFIKMLRLAAIASGSTLIVTLAITLLWSRGPRRWGMVLAICLCAPAITLFAALGYTLAHQINLYNQTVLKREAAEANLLTLEQSLRDKRTELNKGTAAHKAMIKDLKAYAIARAAIQSQSGEATKDVLTRISRHFATDTSIAKNAQTERKMLETVIDASVKSLESKLLVIRQNDKNTQTDSKAQEAAIDTSGKLLVSAPSAVAPNDDKPQLETKASPWAKLVASFVTPSPWRSPPVTAASAQTNQAPPPGEEVPSPNHHRKGVQSVAAAEIQAAEQQKIIDEIDRLNQLKQMLENTSDQALTREIAHVAIAAAAESASKQEINAALIDYIDELTSLSTEQVILLKRSKDNNEQDVNKNIPLLINTAKLETTAARKEEMNEYSMIKNNLGDVRHLIIGNTSKMSAQREQTKYNSTIMNSINNGTQVILIFVLATLMIVCSNEVIFIISVGASVLLFPFAVHSILGMFGTPLRAGFRWRNSIGRILMLIGGAMALYWTICLIGSLFS